LHRDENGEITLGDLIVALDGHPVTEVHEFLKLLEKHEIGEKVKLTITRNAKSRRPEHFEVEVTLQASQ
jgi:S1-C subfamily serine protease